MDIKKLFMVLGKFIPFIIGLTLTLCGIVNVVSSLLLFVGGYLVCKNCFDYRVIRKNINVIKGDKDMVSFFGVNKDRDIYVDRYRYVDDRNRVKRRVRKRDK